MKLTMLLVVVVEEDGWSQKERQERSYSGGVAENQSILISW